MNHSENTVDKKRVLVVDDSRTQLELLKYLLESEGFDVTSFNNGPEALLALEKQVPDLIITDVIMPGMDGYELCRRIKSTPALSSVPVILLTALSGPEDVIMALQCGASTFVTKPCDAVSLTNTIKYLFANRELGSRLTGDHEMAVILHGRKFTLSPSNSQMLDFLISTYEAAVEQGHKLSQSHTALQELNDQLEQKIEERTRELTVAEERFKTMFNEAPLGIALIDSLTGHVYEINRMFAKIAGRTSEQMANIDWMSLTHPDDVQKDLDNMALLNAGKIQRFQMEKRYLHLDGTSVWINMTIAPLKIEDKAHLRHLCMIEDITERKQAEEMKRAREIAEAANRAKSDFLANMSHDLRTPLNSINGFSEVLYDETFGPLNEKQKQYVNNVLTSGKYLLSLINQILDMAKVESGKMKLALSSLPMKSLLNDISMLVADMVSKKKIEMLLEIADDLPNIEADELKVKEIIYNLLSNAVKFTPEGGRIGMRAKKVDSEVEVVVWDTGVGIAAENMEKIFEGFFRVDTPYSRVTEGTGLGLPLSKKLVELHGGKFSVE
ncbi:MAG: response regulator [Dehalococcoidales bacterium]|nr:response regulator [Dehalococcoidales bacterium]